MSSANLPLQHKGIFRNLPTFPAEIKGLTAIVTGANGISGFHTLRVLLGSPQRWKQIWTLSRNPMPPKMMNLIPASQRERIEYVSLDFLADPNDIAKSLVERGVTADVVFFYSYMQLKPDPALSSWSNADALLKVNSSLLGNFLAALTMSSIVPKRILLQTGAKQYGGHIGPTLSPWLESTPRIMIEPNFYYSQEDILFEYCQKTGAKWNVIRPAWIIGAVENAQMNSFYGLGVYAAVQSHLGKPLEFPGTLQAWLKDQNHSHAKLTGYLSEWAVLEDSCQNQAFNASDMASSSWSLLWPELARWFGATKVGRPELDEAKLHTLEMPTVPPPLGFGPPGRVRFSWSLVTWAAQPENHQAWKSIMAEHNLKHDPFLDPEANFAFTDAAVLADGCGRLGMNKSRSMGWNGFVDTAEGVFDTYREMGELGMLPPMVIDQPKPTY